MKALALASRVCKTCDCELPLSSFAPTSFGYLRGSCRRCCSKQSNDRRVKANVIKNAVTQAQGHAKWIPRLTGKDGPGGYTQHPDDGYRFVAIPDSHGYLIDWEAADALLAFVRYYRPVRIFMLGDHVDFASLSRFDKPVGDVLRIGEDVDACRKFLGLVRQSAPDARIHYLKGNHEVRFARHLWKNPAIAKLLESGGQDLPHFLRFAEHGIEWEDSGALMVNDRLIVKHGHMVRSRSGYTATGELERNGISGISGHTHRLGQVYKRSRAGMLTWVESGCLCQYDPDYMEGQLSDWLQGLSFGTVSLKGNGFTVHTAPIINGRVKALGMDISG